MKTTIEVKRNSFEGFARLQIALANIAEVQGKVGWFEESRYPDTPTKKGVTKGLPVAMVAAINEFGYGVPARPFMRPTIAAKQSTWAKIVESESRKIVNGKGKAWEAMKILVDRSSADVAETITKIYSPALAESTILARIRKNATLSKAKGRLSYKKIGLITKPLVDTGLMLSTLYGSVEKV